MTRLSRRGFIAAGALAACSGDAPATWQGGWVGEATTRGHRLRDGAALRAPPSQQRRTAVLIIGAGIAGLAAARAVRRAGIDDFAVLDLHDSFGGNSRGHVLDGEPCPLGAHYLPTPGPHAHEVSEWLHEIGIARSDLGRTRYDERHLCHSPQERLFFDGAWHDGLLPPVDAGSRAAAQHQRFAALVDDARKHVGFALPTRRAGWTDAHARLDAQPFARWLAEHGLDDPGLRWYLDYCCRDDYGAGTDAVSAWAGLHYFASRHGFGHGGDDERDAVLTWPEGNAWLVQRLAADLGQRWRGATVVLRVAEERHRAVADAWDEATGQVHRWSAQRVVVATPLYVAARLVESAPSALSAAAAALRYAPWLVANLQLRSPLLDRVGVPMAWDNVVHGSRGLGYVNARHQSLQAQPRATLLTAYRALDVADRAALLEQPWQAWAGVMVDDLRGAHPDLPAKLQRIDLVRHGHAMSIPVPGVRGHAALGALHGQPAGRLHFAHGDLAGYSVFEEAFTAGDAAGRAAAAALGRR